MVYRLDQALKQLLAALQVGAALFEILEQLVDRRAQLLQRLRLTLESDAAGGPGFERDPPDLLGELADGPLLAPIPNHEHTDAHRQYS
jgi:hypothetical protein